jgi:FixJ family two-component response regulator
MPHRAVTPIKVLLFVRPRDEEAVKRVLGKDFKPTFTKNLAEVLSELQQKAAPVLICEKNVAGVDWKDVWKAVRVLSHPPHLVVVYKHADTRFMLEVVNFGGHDVLRRKPYELAEMIRVIQYAAEAWLKLNSISTTG